jgi:hypothetical protein
MQNIKSYVKQNFPFLVHLVWKLRVARLRSMSMEEVFSEAYQKNTWGDPESRSGRGSNIRSTATLRAVLPSLLRELDTRTMLDIPCGDFHWMKEVDLSINRYIGGDIVKELVESNIQKFGNATREFLVLDITKDTLPQVDLIFCRDCLVHFSNEDVFRGIKNIKDSKSKYLLTTTFTQRETNEDIVTGWWRPLNLQKAPFNFPEPIKVINENYTGQEGLYTDMSQALWRIADLPGTT